MSFSTYRAFIISGSILFASSISLAFASPPAALVASQSLKKELLPMAIQAEKIIDLADADENIVIFDARHPSAHQQGHIAWSIPFSSADLNKNFLKKKVADKSTTIVFYGIANSKAAAEATAYAFKAGYKSVYWLEGGWEEWQQKKLSLK